MITRQPVLTYILAEWPGDMPDPEEFDAEDDSQEELLPDDEDDDNELMLDDEEDYLDEEE